MKRLLKYFILFFVLLNLGYSANAKPVPPGSGEGDVPANILFLLDSSASMNQGVANEDRLTRVTSAVPDSNGDYLVTQSDRALIKYDNDLTRNSDFNDGIGRITGNISQTCAAIHDGATAGYSTGEKDTRITSTVLTTLATGLSTDDLKVDNQNVIFLRTGGAVWADQALLGFSEDGTTCLFYLKVGFIPQSHVYRRIGGQDFLFVSGKSGRNGAFRSFNLNTGEVSRIQTDRFLSNLQRVWRSTANYDGTMFYECRNQIRGYSLNMVGNVYEATARPALYNFVNRGNRDTQLMKVSDCDISPDDNNIMYSVSQQKKVLQKVQLNSNTTYTIIERAGTFSRKPYNLESAGTLAANSVRFKKPYGINVTADEIIVTSRNGTVDIFNENLFTAADVDTSWQGQFGGGRMTRWIGLKKAIAAVLSDTTLTTGAHFGYGHWNAGEHGGARDSAMGGRRCHRNQDQCSYYGGWMGDHPEGHSITCNNDSCLNVAISAQGKDKILGELLPQVTAWGTDGRAYSQMARNYFLNDFDAYDPDSDCQLNYVIVIGDGMINNWDADDALPFIEELRDQPNPIKTLFVAYGGGINPTGMTRFESLAVAGSCPEGDSTRDECYGAIEAQTPADLKQELSRVIRQILAEKLSFTAPSITATVQEGGSLYQAQFAYEQHGEWQGTILRKGLDEHGTVCHDMDQTKCPGNWNAAEQLLGQTTAADMADTRYIWTVADGLDYIGNWDNFHTGNSDTIEELFGLFEFEALDYHNATSYCSTRGYIGENGTDDDVLGLINFVKGSDYFDYDGDCRVTEVREHVLGDIYHSQLIEIGPPDGSLDFTGNNEEAYFRVINNYQSFIKEYESRENLIYAGANDGMLHAFNAETGEEEWAFVPPFIAAMLPTIINPELSGKIPETCPEPTDPPADPPVPCKDDGSGGSNAIFGVDGSPVVHDVFIKGYDVDGNPQENADWHTILFVPYGRGGAGFSVLDITYDWDPDAGTGPIHMFSIFNDSINERVLVADTAGQITEHPYSAGSVNIEDSLEAQAAIENLNTALDTDGGLDSDTTTAQDLIAACQENTDADSGSFLIDGTASCFKGTKFTFDVMRPTSDADGTVPTHTLKVTERIAGVMQAINITSAKMDTGRLIVEFPSQKIFNPGGSVLETSVTNEFNIAHSCTSSDMGEESRMYDYSQMGETWSSPRIARLPSTKVAERDNPAFDTYVAIMGAGMGNTSLCAGSAVFLVNLDNEDHPGALYGYEENGGPIIIVDTDPAGITGLTTPNASDIGNSLPSPAVVITPDTAPNIPWRGAMVYFNDLEGKITKINLTTSTENSADLFDQTTLFTLNANSENKRYSYFQMDAGIGADTRDLWLFGGTGDFTDIGGGSKRMDNILYGVKDRYYPHFAHLNGVHIPPISDASFVNLALEGADRARNIDAAEDCSNTTSLLYCLSPSDANYPKFAWRIHLDTVDGLSPSDPATVNTYRKISAAPTLFEGNVYYPIYQPPKGVDKCNVGMAYICVANDECGSNNSHLLSAGGDPSAACKEVREGILSRLIIFGDELFANVAGPSKDEDTLYQIIAGVGESSSRRSTWRDGGF